MTCTLQLTGNVSVGGGACVCAGAGAQPSSKTMGLSFSCAGTIYGAITSTDCPTSIAATSFIELPGSDSIGRFELLSFKSNAAMTLRIGAAAATILGAGGTFPTGFSGGEAFDFTVDGVNIAGTFTAAAQNIGDVVNELNQAAVGAGFAYLPFAADVSGQVSVTGQETGSDGSVVVNTANATIGFPTAGQSVTGGGSDMVVNGLALIQFNSTDAPTRIQVKGTGQIEVLAAGTAPS